jgi:alkyl hydroperoxide reductase subunit AhpF
MFYKESDREWYREHAQQIENLQELLIFKGGKKKGIKEKVTFPDESTFANEMKALSDNIKVSIHEFAKDTRAKVYGIDRAPAIQIRTQDDYTLTWYGIPTRLLLHPFIDSLIIFSKKETAFTEKVIQRIRSIKKAGHIRVLAASTSPLCWYTISVITQFAVLNKNVKCDIVDVLQFSQLIKKYHVLSVPNVIINQKQELIATHTELHLPEVLLKLLS